ncbi:MAG: sulfur carrier protein ThiS [Chlamydiae bacterium]|nr:sulfur carrier protein ThiS [Chlamydiota bacterium]
MESTHFNTPTHHSCDTDAVGGGQEEQDPPTDSQNKCIEIFLNGQKKSIEKNLTLEKLIQNLGLDSKWVVAEVNGQALIKKDYLNLHLSNGDRIELVRAVSGG